MKERTPDLLLEAFAKVLRLERRRVGLSQEELALRAGKSMRYVSLLESCRHQPSLDTISGLCDGLGTTMSEFTKLIEIEMGKAP